ncbi:UNVERIFIED_CONTAM: F-box protein SKIP24 [Sesamum latifolium]|uniref:F-box protein SKIP24 n=1 Tax=Sesamum latifolium TaxID=2727402 RepID=A0AAW2XKI8_9LAMI
MSVLPDELWTRIMELGIQTKTLDQKNLCCLSIACRRLHRLAADDSLWSRLLLSDFPSSARDFNLKNDDNSTSSIRDNNCTSSSAASVNFKSLYRIRYEKDREQKRLAHRRTVLRIESEIAERLRKIQEIELQTSVEKEKINKAVAELLNMHKARAV